MKQVRFDLCVQVHENDTEYATIDTDGWWTQQERAMARRRLYQQANEFGVRERRRCIADKPTYTETYIEILRLCQSKFVRDDTHTSMLSTSDANCMLKLMQEERGLESFIVPLMKDNSNALEKQRRGKDEYIQSIVLVQKKCRGDAELLRELSEGATRSNRKMSEVMGAVDAFAAKLSESDLKETYNGNSGDTSPKKKKKERGFYQSSPTTSPRKSPRLKRKCQSPFQKSKPSQREGLFAPVL